MNVFRNAGNGIVHAWRTQRNLRIQAGLAVIAILVFALLHASPVVLAVVVLVSALVLAMEIMNTALEALVDLVSPQFHPLARAAKDAAAGAVLIVALGAVAVGLLLLAGAERAGLYR